MTDDDPSRRIAELIARRAGVPPERVRPDARLVDFGLDSVQVTDLVMDLEEAFGFAIPDPDIADLETIGDIGRYVRKRRG